MTQTTSHHSPETPDTTSVFDTGVVDVELIGIDGLGVYAPAEREVKLQAARQAIDRLRLMRAEVSAFVDTSRLEQTDFLKFSARIMEAVELIVRLNSTMEQLTGRMEPAIIGSLASIPNMDSQISEKERILAHLEQFERDLEWLYATLATKEREILITQQLIESREVGEGSNLPNISQIGKNASGINDSHIERARKRLPELLQEREALINEIDEKVASIISASQIIDEEASVYVANLAESHDKRVNIIDETKARAEEALRVLGQSVVNNPAVRGALLADPSARLELISLPEVRAALVQDSVAVRALLEDEHFVRALLARSDAADALMAKLLDDPREITDK